MAAKLKVGPFGCWARCDLPHDCNVERTHSGPVDEDDGAERGAERVTWTVPA